MNVDQANRRGVIYGPTPDWRCTTHGVLLKTNRAGGLDCPGCGTLVDEPAAVVSGGRLV